MLARHTRVAPLGYTEQRSRRQVWVRRTQVSPLLLSARNRQSTLHHLSTRHHFQKQTFTNRFHNGTATITKTRNLQGTKWLYHGTAKYNNNEQYTGYFKHETMQQDVQIPHDQRGELQTPDALYKGTFNLGQFLRGKIIYIRDSELRKEGDSYIGSVNPNNRQPHGRGVLTVKVGDTTINYEGSFENGFKAGLFTVTEKTADRRTVSKIEFYEDLTRSQNGPSLALTAHEFNQIPEASYAAPNNDEIETAPVLPRMHSILITQNPQRSVDI